MHSSNLKIILFGLFKYPWGCAAASQLRHIGLGLREAGTSVQVLTMGPDVWESGSEAEKRLLGTNPLPYESCLGKKPSVGRLARFVDAGKVVLRARRKLRQHLSDGSANIIIVDEPDSMVYLAVAGLQKFKNATIITRRVEWYEPEVFRYGAFHPIYQSHRLGRRWDLKIPHGIIAISEYIEKQYQGRVPSIRIPTIFDFSSIPTPTSCARQTNEDCRLVYASELKPNDGAGDLLEAVRIARKRGVPCTLSIVGIRPERREAQELRHYVEGVPELRGAVHLPGRVPENEYMSFLGAATALVILRKPDVRSLASFPTRLPEYLATGRPVITSNVPDIPHYLADRVHAHVVEPCRPDLIAERITEIWKDPQANYQLGKRGRARGEECFDYRSEGVRLCEFLKKVAENRTSATCQPL